MPFQSSDKPTRSQHHPPLPEQLLSILNELALLDCADALAAGGFNKAADIVAAGAESLIVLGLKKPHAHRIVNRARTIALTKGEAVPDHAIPGQRVSPRLQSCSHH